MQGLPSSYSLSLRAMYNILIACVCVLCSVPSIYAQFDTKQTVDENVCVDMPDGVHVHPLDCRQYFHCLRGNTYIFRCFKGFVFHPTLRRCVFRSECLDDSGTTETVRRKPTSGLLADAVIADTTEITKPAPTRAIDPPKSIIFTSTPHATYVVRVIFSRRETPKRKPEEKQPVTVTPTDASTQVTVVTTEVPTTTTTDTITTTEIFTTATTSIRRKSTSDSTSAQTENAPVINDGGTSETKSVAATLVTQPPTASVTLDIEDTSMEVLNATELQELQVLLVNATTTPPANFTSDDFGTSTEIEPTVPLSTIMTVNQTELDELINQGYNVTIITESLLNSTSSGSTEWLTTDSSEVTETEWNTSAEEGNKASTSDATDRSTKTTSVAIVDEFTNAATNHASISTSTSSSTISTSSAAKTTTAPAITITTEITEDHTDTTDIPVTLTTIIPSTTSTLAAESLCNTTVVCACPQKATAAPDRRLEDVNKIDDDDMNKEVVKIDQMSDRLPAVSEELEIYCAQLRCFNGGMFVGLSNGHCGCVCAKEFAGNQCEHLIDESKCRCENSGRCVSVGNDTYTCQCTLGFLGPRCQYSIDDIQPKFAALVQFPHRPDSWERHLVPAQGSRYVICKTNVCLNGGMCFKDMDSGATKCYCSDNYGGRFCEHRFPT